MSSPPPIAVGLVGAGPWAEMVHAPVIAAGPETTLAGVWARRPEAAARLAERFRTTACARFEELLDRSEAVAFCVPPDVQARMAVGAARAGKALLLEKPLALELAEAERLAGAVAEAGVANAVVLSYRYAAATRRFLDEAPSLEAFGGRGCFLSGALLAGPFAMGWRLVHGALLDIGPHLVDLADAALGPVTEVRAAGDPLGWLGLLLRHESGAVSDLSLCARTDIGPGRTELELFGPSGNRLLDARAAAGPAAFATLRAEFAELCRGGRPGPHTPGVERGLHLQRILDQAARQLA